MSLSHRADLGLHLEPDKDNSGGHLRGKCETKVMLPRTGFFMCASGPNLMASLPNW
jgi:hypothetical protein